MNRLFCTFATVSALALLVGSSSVAKAELVFSFCVENTIGNVAGVFSGEIFGLTDNATSSATKVVIESFPIGLNSLVGTGEDAVLWDQQNQNSFTVSGGMITAGGFWAQQTIGSLPYGYQLYLNGDGGPFNFLNLDGIDSAFVRGNNGFAAAHFSRNNAVPEPGSIALVASLGLTAVAAFRRRRAR